METIADLRRKINTAIYNIKTQIPAKVAESMDRETRLNFEREEYGNDGTPRKWADRWGKNFKTKKFENVEAYLRYPKLRHTGRLARSIAPFYGRGFAGLRAAAPYAELQTRGKAPVPEATLSARDPRPRRPCGSAPIPSPDPLWVLAEEPNSMRSGYTPERSQNWCRKNFICEIFSFALHS